MSCNPPSLPDTQADYEQRFNCVICLSARFDLIWGHCQHKVCAECLYKDGCLRNIFLKCPVCQHHWTFPLRRPDVIEDNMEIMRCLGVRSCPNQSKGCPTQMWQWELEQHARVCSWRPKSPQVRKVCDRSTSSKKKKPAPMRVTRSSKQLRSYCDNKIL